METFLTASEADILLQADGLTDKGQPGEFELGSNRSWKLTSKPEWVTLNHESGVRGRQKIYVSAAKNTTGEDRQGFLEFELDNGQPEQVAVYQYRLAEKIKVDKTEFAVNLLGLGEDGKASVVAISSNYVWSLTADEGSEWIEPSAKAGDAGEATVTLQVKANDTKADRQGRLTFKAGKTVIGIIVSQAAVAFDIPIATLTLSKSGKETISGDNGVIDIDALEEWSVTDKADWLTCSPMTGKAGKTKMTVTATLNTGEPREGTITLRSEHGVEATLVIKQDNKVTLKPDDKPEGHVYFSEPFDWAHQIALLYPDHCQDQVGSIGGSAGNTIPIYSNADAKHLFDQTLEDLVPGGKCIYIADGYIKLGRGNNQTGVVIKKALDIPEGRMADVEVSFDIADNKQDPTVVVVEISGDGQIVDGVSATKSHDIMPIKNTDPGKPWQWSRDQKVRIKGVTADTRISIHSRQMGLKGYYRWFLDNIKVTRITTNK
ncbi:BACON domain-containing protein [Prevotella sp. A2931]|uniref:BACON domain-containing protein n=2 Tax=Prevotellaceae TaxID=171552 RepID=A0ABS3M2F8_9BACT|nr:BACON domain-containing protein [Prevotella illustrans]PTL27334.1 ABC transporter [Prevotella sp. oral taxon 820]